jgi:hypothetical protein
VGRRGGCGCPSGLRTPGPNPQKIMHTRKRHQDMFQDLNRKLQHAAEKEKEVPGADSKVRSTGSAPVTFPGLAVPSQMCKGQGRRILSLALSGRFQSVLPHSTDPIMETAATAWIRAVGCVGCCSLWESLPKSPSLSSSSAPTTPLALSSQRSSRLPTRGPGRASASPTGRLPG